MADNMDGLSNFSIEETMNMGVGDTELIKDLMAPETSGDPDDIKPVEEDAPKPSKNEKKGEKKEVKPEEAEETDTSQSLLSNFLESDENQEETPEEPVKQKEEDVDEPPSQFTALAKDLYKLGIFTKDDEEEDTPVTTAEEFLERFQNEKKKGATEAIQNFIGQFGEDYQTAFDAIYVKGANPKEYFGVYNSIVDFAQMDMSKEQNQETVVHQALTDQGLEPEDVVTEIERLKNYGDLETVAAKHHKVLVKKEALKLQQIEQKAEEDLRNKIATKNQYIKNVQDTLQEKLKVKEFDGIPINPKLAAELQDFLLVDKWKTSSGETLTDFDRAILELKRPENHATKVKLGLLLKIMEKDPTLSTIQKSGITKKTDQLFSETARQKVTSKAPIGSKHTSWFQQ